MSTTIKAYAANAPKAPLQPFEYEPGPLGDEQVDVAVSYCGICHSDLSMMENEWGMTAYPFVGGHEIVGKVVAMGDHVKNLRVGQTVGVGWYSRSCMTCRQCMSGDHNLCPTAEATIIHHHGGFATQVRAHSAWTIPLPEGVDPAKAGPLFCGGITVFNPMVQFGVRPTDRVGVIGIGGLGHMALKFLRAWGCDVIAFTSSDSKRDEALQLGANRVVNSRNSAEMEKLASSFNFILSTVNAGHSRLAGLHQRARAKGPPAHRRRHCRAGKPRGVSAARRPALVLRFAARQPGDDGRDAGIRRAPRHRADDRVFPDVENQRRLRAPQGRQGPLPHRARERPSVTIWPSHIANGGLG